MPKIELPPRSLVFPQARSLTLPVYSDGLSRDLNPQPPLPPRSGPRSTQQRLRLGSYMLAVPDSGGLPAKVRALVRDGKGLFLLLAPHGKRS